MEEIPWLFTKFIGMTTNDLSLQDDDYGALTYRNIERIRLGKYEFNTWFGNSTIFFPNEPDTLACKIIRNNIRISGSKRKLEEYASTMRPWLKLLHICPYCFKYTDNEKEMKEHSNGCPLKFHLMGKVMYCDGEVTVRKVKGSRHRLFCQCLCILAKFFLENKSVFFNLEHYDFYVLYKVLDGISTPMGFFSKELLSWEGNNLSCIMVIPCYQKQHLGTKLIDFSYRLSQFEQVVSGPERPFSSLGKIAYLRYWSGRLCLHFLYGRLSTYRHVTLKFVSQQTGFRMEDILMALNFMNTFYVNGKKRPYSEYCLQNLNEDDDCVCTEEIKQDNKQTIFGYDGYNLFIDKSRMKQWVVDHKISDSPVLKKEYLILY